MINPLLNALLVLYPNVEWSYNGDGTDLSGLVWPEGAGPVPTLAEVQQKADELAAAKIAADNEMAVVKTDLITQYQAALTRLDDIVTNGPTYTQVQARDAIVDLARIQRRLLKYIKATLILVMVT